MTNTKNLLTKKGKYISKNIDTNLTEIMKEHGAILQLHDDTIGLGVLFAIDIYKHILYARNVCGTDERYLRYMYTI